MRSSLVYILVYCIVLNAKSMGGDKVTYKTEYKQVRVNSKAKQVLEDSKAVYRQRSLSTTILYMSELLHSMKQEIHTLKADAVTAQQEKEVDALNNMLRYKVRRIHDEKKGIKIDDTILNECHLAAWKEVEDSPRSIITDHAFETVGKVYAKRKRSL